MERWAWALAHQKDTKRKTRAIHDCEEILDGIIEDKVSEWLR
jgi:hypothetical protein